MKIKIFLIVFSGIVAAALLAQRYPAQNHKSHESAASISPQKMEKALEHLAVLDKYHRAGRHEEADQERRMIIELIGQDGVGVVYAARHQKMIQAIDNTTKYIRQGDSYMLAKRYEEAATTYKKAYELGGDYAVSGLQLAKMYEKLGRYDDGIQLLDEMISKGYLSETGIENAKAIQHRLIAAKNDPVSK